MGILSKLKTWLAVVGVWAVTMLIAAVIVWRKATDVAAAKRAEEALKNVKTVTQNRIDAKSKTEKQLDEYLSGWSPHDEDKK